MALTYTSYTPDTATGVIGGDITSTSRTYNSGDLVVVMVSTADNVPTGTLTISNSGTAQSWTNRATTNTNGNCKVAMWFCVMSTTQAMTITVLGNGGGNVDSALYVVAHQGQHASDPIPTGKVASGVGGEDVTTSITPTATGSCLWMVVGDWNQANALAAATNNTKEFGTNQAGQQTTALYRPTTQPRTDTNAFTIGSASDGTGEIETWIAFEVQAAAAATVELPPLTMAPMIPPQGCRL